MVMSWSNWFKDDNGDSVSEKIVERSDGGKTVHILRDTGGDKDDHQHIVVQISPSGKTERAHGVPIKSKR